MSLEKVCLIHDYVAFQCAGVLGWGHLPLKTAPTVTSFICWRREDTKAVAKCYGRICDEEISSSSQFSADNLCCIMLAKVALAMIQPQALPHSYAYAGRLFRQQLLCFNNSTKKAIGICDFDAKTGLLATTTSYVRRITWSRTRTIDVEDISRETIAWYHLHPNQKWTLFQLSRLSDAPSLRVDNLLFYMFFL